MVTSKTKSAKVETTTPKRKKSTGGSGKKLTPYNRFIRQELQRLKTANPTSTHAERFKLAASNWKHSPDNKKK